MKLIFRITQSSLKEEWSKSSEFSDCSRSPNKFIIGIIQETQVLKRSSSLQIKFCRDLKLNLRKAITDNNFIQGLRNMLGPRMIFCFEKVEPDTDWITLFKVYVVPIPVEVVFRKITGPVRFHDIKTQA